MQKEIKASGINPVSQLDWSVHIPAEWPARALVWMCGSEADEFVGRRFRAGRGDPGAGRPRVIRVDEDGDLRSVTLDRVDKANALTRSMLTDLVDATRAARGAKAVIFTGAGGVFSAGADLEEARAGLATDPLWERLSASVAALPGLTVAALNGSAAGGSLGPVLACDLRVAVPAPGSSIRL